MPLVVSDPDIFAPVAERTPPEVTAKLPLVVVIAPVAAMSSAVVSSELAVIVQIYLHQLLLADQPQLLQILLHLQFFLCHKL